jgi:hypothetical protein
MSFDAGLPQCQVGDQQAAVGSNTCELGYERRRGRPVVVQVAKWGEGTWKAEHDQCQTPAWGSLNAEQYVLEGPSPSLLPCGCYLPHQKAGA